MDNLLIGDFEGPLDLLLHLIKKSKMEIFDIEISKITEEYINYINSMAELNLDIASEYLVMASELIEMKSKKLLPVKEEKEEEEDINPEEELKRRLIEYKKYKESTEVFRNLEEKRSNYFTKSPENIKNYSLEKLENDGNVSLFDLLDAFQKLLERREASKPRNTKIARKEMSVKERVIKIRDILKTRKTVNFVELFDDFSKPYVVVTFLSVLEMVKGREINIKQDSNFSEIYLERVD
ncbi:MAG: segregation/condensation protein A [Tenericutes bacterium]|nr:segregation/condensation protein A [Mycoplasmatota bacterium]